MKIALIAAVGERGELGAGNRLLWHISEDLRNFKSLTMGHHILMGRKTFESIGRALPGRTSIVLSHREQANQSACVLGARTLEAGVNLARAAGESCLYIIGGGEIYRQALPLADTIFLTRVSAVYPEADTWFPDIRESDWRVLEEKSSPSVDQKSPAWTWQHLEKSLPAFPGQGGLRRNPIG